MSVRKPKQSTLRTVDSNVQDVAMPSCNAQDECKHVLMAFANLRVTAKSAQYYIPRQQRMLSFIFMKSLEESLLPHGKP